MCLPVARPSLADHAALKQEQAKGKMASNEIHIWGSCVSRDSVEFADGIRIGKYCARQSVVSSVAPIPSIETISSLLIKAGTHDFHRRCIEDDFRKSSLNLLTEQSSNQVIIVDFIEERAPLGLTHCNTVITLSEAASAYSNAESLLARKINPWSQEYVALFEKAIVDFSYRLRGRPVVIHYALYAEHRRKFPEINSILSHYYDLAISHIKPIAVIKPRDDLLKSNPLHKWGAGPYHYVDGYYQDFVEQFVAKTGIQAAVKQAFTLQKASY